MARWYLGLDPAAVQDGRYLDFHRGQQAQFAVDAELGAWERAPEGPATAVRVEGCQYDVVARVTTVGDEAWQLDCGLPAASREPPPEGIGVGDWVRARARLVISRHPPTTSSADGSPAPISTWYVERIHHRTTADDDPVDLGLFGPPEEPGWEELAFTDAWRDDDGRPEYVLECSPVDETPPGAG